MRSARNFPKSSKKILFDKEKVSADNFFAHGGLFKVPGVAQQILANAFATPVLSVAPPDTLINKLVYSDEVFTSTKGPVTEEVLAGIPTATAPFAIMSAIMRSAPQPVIATSQV